MSVKGEKNFLNFFNTPEDWEFTEQYNIPIIPGFKLKKDMKLDLVEFNMAHNVSKNNRKNKIVSFFLADYLFERAWNFCNKTGDFLSDFKAVLSPDYSQYMDMPKAMKIWNHYRKMWLTKYWSDMGIRVIPVACWSDEESYEYCFEGYTKGSVICVSTVGVMNDRMALYHFEKGYEAMKEAIEPSQIMFYGKVPDFVDKKEVSFECKHIRDKRFKQLETQNKLSEIEIPVAKSKLLEE